MSSVPTGGPLGVRQYEPEGTLVLRGAAHGLARPKRIQLIAGIATIVLALAFFAVIFALTLSELHFDEKLHVAGVDPQARFDQWLMYDVLMTLIFLCTPALILGVWSWMRRLERSLAEAELWLSPDHATYVCTRGRFTAPSAAVRWIGFTGPPGPDGELRIDVQDWGGPLKNLTPRKRPHALLIPLAGADRRTVAQAVHAATGGQAVLNPG